MSLYMLMQESNDCLWNIYLSFIRAAQAHTIVYTSPKAPQQKKPPVFRVYGCLYGLRPHILIKYLFTLFLNYLPSSKLQFNDVLYILRHNGKYFDNLSH